MLSSAKPPWLLIIHISQILTHNYQFHYWNHLSDCSYAFPIQQCPKSHLLYYKISTGILLHLFDCVYLFILLLKIFNLCPALLTALLYSKNTQFPWYIVSCTHVCFAYITPSSCISSSLQTLYEFKNIFIWPTRRHFTRKWPCNFITFFCCTWLAQNIQRDSVYTTFWFGVCRYGKVINRWSSRTRSRSVCCVLKIIKSVRPLSN